MGNRICRRPESWDRRSGAQSQLLSHACQSCGDKNRIATQSMMMTSCKTAATQNAPREHAFYLKRSILEPEMVLYRKITRTWTRILLILLAATKSVTSNIVILT